MSDVARARPDRRRGIPVAAVLMAGAAAGCGDPAAPRPPAAVAITVPDGFAVEVVAASFDLPTSLAFPPDGSDRLFVNELQSGRVRIVRNGVPLPEPFAEVPTATEGGFPVAGENGLLGLAFDPDYAVNGYVYVTYATRSDTGTFGTVARFTDVDNRGRDFTVLLDGIPCAPGHQVESLAFGPDGLLYVSTGDAFRDEHVQDTGTVVGKILRMDRDGGLPADNPFAGSYTYAYGFRNAFDLAFDDAGRLFATDNGPERDDELNRIVAGGNYGWPLALGAAGGPGFEAPAHVWPEIVAPAGMAFYRGTQFPAAYRGKLFLVLFGDTFTEGPSERAKRVQVVDPAAAPPAFADFAVYAFSGRGNPVDAAVGPDGSLYLSDIFQGRVFRIRYRG